MIQSAEWGILAGGALSILAFVAGHVRAAMGRERQRSNDTYARLDAMARVETSLKFISKQLEQLLERGR